MRGLQEERGTGGGRDSALISGISLNIASTFTSAAARLAPVSMVVQVRVPSQARADPDADQSADARSA